MFLCVYILIDFQAILQPTKIFLHPLNLLIGNFLGGKIIKSVKKAGFWDTGGIFSPYIKSVIIFSVKSILFNLHP